jgi:hypothetical protein
LTQREQIATIGSAIGRELPVEEIELMTARDRGMAPATG